MPKKKRVSRAVRLSVPSTKKERRCAGCGRIIEKGESRLYVFQTRLLYGSCCQDKAFHHVDEVPERMLGIPLDDYARKAYVVVRQLRDFEKERR